MRPIDADGFKELVLSKKETDPYIVGVMINAIDAMPTIEDRKKGEWIKPKEHDHLLQCSECEYEVTIDMAYEYNYCPLCGADMRGEYENE